MGSEPFAGIRVIQHDVESGQPEIISECRRFVAGALETIVGGRFDFDHQDGDVVVLMLLDIEHGGDHVGVWSAARAHDLSGYSVRPKNSYTQGHSGW